MIPAAFEYARAESLEHAIALLGADEDAKVLAGGHSLLPLMRLRLAQPSTLVDITRIDGLSEIRDEGDELVIGALATHHAVANSDVVASGCPIVAHVAGKIGDPAVRHVGTFGGSLAHADPASDLPAVLLALGATMSVKGPGGAAREVPAADFFRGVFEPDLASDEVLEHVHVPKHAGGWSHIKFHRRQQDYALVGVATVAGNGSVPTVALTNMGDRPLRAAEVEQALAGGADPATAAEQAAEGTNPPSDSFASAEYRRELSKVLVRRALEQAMS